MNLMKAISISTGVASLIGSIFFVISYVATAEEHKQLKQYTEYSFDEIKLERLDDKINIIQVKPESERKSWEIEKLLMLKSQQERIIRRIEYNDK